MTRGRRPRLLIVSHEASRTGAVRVALDVLDAVPPGQWDVTVVLRWSGPQRAEFLARGATVVREPLRHLRVALRLHRSTRRLAVPLERAVAAVVVAGVRPDLVWCNTVLSACYVGPARSRGVRTVLHAHEKGGHTADVLSRYDLGRWWPGTELVACAPRVAADLAAATGRPPAAVTVLLSVPDGDQVRGRAEPGPPPHPHPHPHPQPSPQPPGGPLVGACGVPNRGKGFDLWLAMAERVATDAADLDPRFVWIGGPVPAGWRPPSPGHPLRGRITITGSVANPYPLLAGLDVMTVPSRDDPFPLVVLEALHLGRPVVAFADGGVPDQVGDAGRLVPPGDPVALADAVIALLRDPAERARLGDAGRRRVTETFDHRTFVRNVREMIGAPAR